MIILLALLNDIPILTITYDNARISSKPVRWDMYEMFVMAFWLGVAGVMSSFTLYVLLKDYWRLSQDLISVYYIYKTVGCGTWNNF